MSILRFALLLSLADGCAKVVEPEQYMMVDELTARDPETLLGRSLRVHGFVQPGSVTQRVIDQKSLRTFIVHQKGKSIRVFFEGPVPDTFRDQAEVVVAGKLVPAATKSAVASAMGVTIDGPHVIEGTEISAKCPTKYDGVGTGKKP